MYTTITSSFGQMKMLTEELHRRKIAWDNTLVRFLPSFRDNIAWYLQQYWGMHFEADTIPMMESISDLSQEEVTDVVLEWDAEAKSIAKPSRSDLQMLWANIVIAKRHGKARALKTVNRKKHYEKMSQADIDRACERIDLSKHFGSFKRMLNEPIKVK